MAHRRIKPGEVINLYEPEDDLPRNTTLALMKTSDMEAIRMVLPEGKEVTEHSVDGEVSIQCIDGKTEIVVGDETHLLTEGDWLYLSRHQPHSMKVLANTVLLVTILFVQNSGEEE